MGQTKIEWTDATWNPITGCTKAVLNKPLHWRKPRMVVVCPMGDLFHKDVPDETIADVWARMFLAGEQHVFQVLAKRSSRMATVLCDDAFREQVCNIVANHLDPHCEDGDLYFEHCDQEWPFPHVWAGVTVESQDYDHRIVDLLTIPAAVRFVSYEPALGPLVLRREWLDCQGESEFDVLPAIDWLIAGGESGPGARPPDANWFRRVRGDCQVAGVPLFFKQHGAWLHETQVADSGPTYDAVKAILAGRHERRIHYWDDGSLSYRVGKKAAGRLLDGRTWDEMPER